MVCYREWFGEGSKDDVGLRLTAEQVRDGIIDRTEEEITYSVADPAIFAQDGGPSIAERQRPIYWKPADNKRIARAGQAGGWDMMRGRMIGSKYPMIYWFNTCYGSIKTIPALQHDPNRAEDLDTHANDHCADTTRYACMSRPWNPVTSISKAKTDPWGRKLRESNSCKVM